MKNSECTKEESELIEKARNYFSEYCAKECKALCCRKGCLVLRKDEVQLVTKGIKKNIKKLDNGLYKLTLEGSPCPRLNKKDYACTIHKNQKRPQLCKDFPVFVCGKYLMTPSFCPLVKNKKLEPFLKELEKLGYIVL